MTTIDTLGLIYGIGMGVFVYCYCNWGKWRLRITIRRTEEAYNDLVLDISRGYGMLGESLSIMNDVLREFAKFMKASDELKETLGDDN